MASTIWGGEPHLLREARLAQAPVQEPATNQGILRIHGYSPEGNRSPVFSATVAWVGPSRDAIGDLARWRDGPVTGLKGDDVGLWAPRGFPSNRVPGFG